MRGQIDDERLVRYSVVVPTVGRPSLAVLLRSLADQAGHLPEEVVVVDDRQAPGEALKLPDDVTSRLAVRVLPGFGRGPAAARNVGWRIAREPWVVFLDDDVVLPAGWAQDLALDLQSAGPSVGGVQGRLVVPLPRERRPTDWERSTSGLQDARWATADLAYRRDALTDVQGFDERFPRAYREDADLALRVRRAGWSLERGRRSTLHPVRPASDGISLRVQRGNSDDALMRRLHGRQWRRLAETGRGRLRTHAATVALALVALVVPAARPGSRARWAGTGALAGWAFLTARFARQRIAPGPGDPHEVWRMLWTSVAIPPAAVWHRASGWWLHRAAESWPPPVRCVLFDRDGTLVHDVPYNGDVDRVAPVPTAAPAVERLRSAGVLVGVVTNQSGVARGLLTREQVDAVNARVDALLGPFDTWQLCPHGPDDGCSCRKPAPGLVYAAARELGVRPEECAVIGDIGTDVLAARAAGARAVLVPTPATRPDEIRTAPVVAPDLCAAVDLLMGAP